MNIMREVAELQTEYQRLIDEKRLTKREICDLCIPFQDKYGLKDSQRSELSGKRWIYLRWRIC